MNAQPPGPVEDIVIDCADGTRLRCKARIVDVIVDDTNPDEATATVKFERIGEWTTEVEA